VWIRATVNFTTQEILFYYSADATNDPDEVSWTQLGDAVATAYTAIYSGSAALSTGYNDGANYTTKGRQYVAAVYNGIDGTKVFHADFTDTNAVTEPFATFTEKSSNAATVTINRAASGAVSTVVDQAWMSFTTDDYFTIADHANLDFDDTDDWTILFVARNSPHAAFGSRWIFKRAANGYLLEMVSSGADMGVGLFLDGSTSSQNVGDIGVHQIPDLTRFVGGAVVNVSGTGKAKTFADRGTGLLFGPDTAITASGTYADTAAFQVGAAGTYPEGTVSAVAIWREALTDAEIYAAGQELIGARYRPKLFSIGQELRSGV